MQAGGLSSAIPNGIKDYLNSENMTSGKKRRRNEQKFSSTIPFLVSKVNFAAAERKCSVCLLAFRIIICPLVNLWLLSTPVTRAMFAHQREFPNKTSHSFSSSRILAGNFHKNARS